MKLNSLLNRILVGLILAMLIVITTIGPLFLLLIFISAWITVATIELLHLLKIKGINLNPYFTIFANLALFILIFFNFPKPCYLLPILPILVAGLLQQENRSLVFAFGIFIYFYLGFLPAHFLLLKQFSLTDNFSTWLVLFPLFLTWVNDTAALLVGMSIGKNQLAPLISKNKTVEGFFGGVLFSALFAYGYLRKFLPNQPLVIFPILGAIMGTFAQIGDLVESVFKREASLKDSSTTLYAHGGFLDRIDSLLFTIPVFYYYLYYTLKS